MKKALVVLLILAVAGGAFAQGWAFTGYADTGIGIFFRQDEGARAKLVSRDAGVDGNRVQFAGAYTAEAKDYGFSFRLRSENGGSPSLNYGYGWLSGLGGIVTGYAGVIDNDLAGINTGDLIFDGRGGEGLGLYTVIKPISVLSVGFGAFGTNTDTIWPQQLKYSGGLAVTLPDLAKFVVSFRNANKVGTVGTTTFETEAGIGNDAQVAAGVNILAVQGLKASVAGVLNRVEEFGDLGVIRIFETAEYTAIQNLTVGLGLWEAFVTGGDAKDAFKLNYGDDPSLSFRAWVYVSYGLLDGKIVPRLDVNYLMGGYWDNEDRIHFDDRFNPNFDSKANLFSIRPSVGFQVTKNAWFELGYIANKYMGDHTVYNATGDKERLNHALYADIKVSW
jgi:hypothetical protein